MNDSEPHETIHSVCPMDQPEHRHEQDRLRDIERQRVARVKRVFVITLVLNWAVALAKGLYGYTSGSVTMSGDAFHSLLDGSSNVLALLGMHFAATPADAGHPYGHRKFEIVAALGIGLLIAVSLIEIAGSAWQALAGNRPPPIIGWSGFAVVAFSMAVNAFVARYESRQAKLLDSPLLEADAHHTQSDLYASGAVLLSFIGARSGLVWADGVCGFVVVIMVGQVAWAVFRDNIPSLLDAAVLDPTRVQALASAIPGVENIHRIRSRGAKWAVELDLHMQVAADMSVEHAHRLAHAVEDELRAKVPHVSDVVVHVEPVIGTPLPK